MSRWGVEVIRRTRDVAKLRLTTGETAARRAAAMAERWRNMVWSNGVAFVVVRSDIDVGSRNKVDHVMRLPSNTCPKAAPESRARDIYKSYLPKVYF